MRADVPLDDLREWERGARIPRKYAAQVKWALWSIKRDAALAISGLPECEWIEQQIEGQGEDLEVEDLEEIGKHSQTCETCKARSAYVERHVGPMPPMRSGLFARALSLVDRFSGWSRAAVGGALLLLAFAGIGVPILLGMAVVTQDLSYVLGAAGLFAVLVGSGAVGGVIFYATTPFRERGTFGHYLSGILTVYGYLLTIYAMAAVGALFVGWEAVGPEIRDMIATPSGWVITGVTGFFFGLVFGWSTRDRNGA